MSRERCLLATLTIAAQWAEDHKARIYSFPNNYLLFVVLWKYYKHSDIDTVMSEVEIQSVQGHIYEARCN